VSPSRKKTLHLKRLLIITLPLITTCILFFHRAQNQQPTSLKPQLPNPLTTASLPQDRTNSPRTSPASLAQHRLMLLNSRYGKMPIGDLLQALGKTPGGPDVQIIFQALALRKQEALPIIKARLREGEVWEKNLLTKFLRLCPWPETRDDLLALTRAENGHWLPRQGAVYALGSLGDATVGPDVLQVLNSPETPLNLQMAAISTLARIGYPAAIPAITSFAQAENPHIRLFATRALTELSQPIDETFLFSSIKSDDYVIRQEASEALWKIDGQSAADALGRLAAQDANEAVRDGASQALLRRELDAQHDQSRKVDILRNSLDHAERLTATWILRTALDQLGDQGHSFVEGVASRDDSLGERARAYLIFADSRTM
jgi:hypothetical protein